MRLAADRPVLLDRGVVAGPGGLERLGREVDELAEQLVRWRLADGGQVPDRRLAGLDVAAEVGLRELADLHVLRAVFECHEPGGAHLRCLLFGLGEPPDDPTLPKRPVVLGDEQTEGGDVDLILQGDQRLDHAAHRVVEVVGVSEPDHRADGLAVVGDAVVLGADELKPLAGLAGCAELVDGLVVDEPPSVAAALDERRPRPIVVGRAVGGGQLPGRVAAHHRHRVAGKHGHVTGAVGDGGAVHTDLAGVEPVALPRLPHGEVAGLVGRLETLDVHPLHPGVNDVLQDVHSGHPGQAAHVSGGVRRETAQRPVLVRVVAEVRADHVEALALRLADAPHLICQSKRLSLVQRHPRNATVARPA